MFTLDVYKRQISMMIPVDKIREVIGSGGKVINKIIDDTGVKIDINDDGLVYIASPDVASAEKAKSIIESIITVSYTHLIFILRLQ